MRGTWELLATWDDERLVRRADGRLASTNRNDRAAVVSAVATFAFLWLFDPLIGAAAAASVILARGVVASVAYAAWRRRRSTQLTRFPEGVALVAEERRHDVHSPGVSGPDASNDQVRHHEWGRLRASSVGRASQVRSCRGRSPDVPTNVTLDGARSAAHRREPGTCRASTHAVSYRPTQAVAASRIGGLAHRCSPRSRS